MVKRELKSFELILGDKKYTCNAPCSVAEVLGNLGESLPDNCPAPIFETTVTVEESALAMKNFFIRIKGVYMPCEVYFADKLIGRLDGKRPIVNLDAKDAVKRGENRLSLRFVDGGASASSAGLFASPEILRFQGAIIDRVSLNQRHEGGTVSLGINLDLLGNPEGVRAVATLVSSTGQIYYAGLTKGRGSINITDPLFWWPKGLGVQNLYRLSLNLYGETDIEDSAEMRIGLRKITSDGNSLVVGGVKIVPMGAVYMPDPDRNPITAGKRADAYVTAAAMCDFNTLVVPADAPTPCDKFYEMCDVHGIMVIEEHKSLNSGEFDAIRRRSHHASLSLIELLGADDASKIKGELERCVPNLDCLARDMGLKYISEPTLPAVSSIRAGIAEHERTLFSHSIEAIAEDGAIQRMLLSVAERYPYPSNLSEFSYVSALAAANHVDKSVRDARMSLAKSGRAIFHRLGDTALAISASSVDYKYRWKPLQYYCKNEFSPVRVYAEYSDGYVIFSASNQRRSDLSGTLEYRILDAGNRVIDEGSEHVELLAMTSIRLLSKNLQEKILGNERTRYVEFLIKEGASVVSKDVLLFVPEKHFEFKKPKITANVSGDGRRFSITLSAECFIKDLELSFEGVEGIFTENYINLTSDAPVKIEFTVVGSPESASRMKDMLRLRSVADIK